MQDHGQQESPVTDTLDAVSVTALAERPLSPVKSLSGSSLRSLSSHSVADAIRYFAGVQVKDYGGIGGLKTVNVRSLGARHTGIFYDGIKIENAQNGQVDLGKYSLDNLEELSVYNAQKSGTLQSASEYASSASVYLRTRVPTFENGPTNLTARMRYGSFSTLNPSVRIEHRHKRAALTAEAMFLHTDGDYRFSIHNPYEDTTARRANGDVEAVRAEFGLFARPANGDLQARAYFYSSERGLPGPVVRRLSEQYASRDRQWDRNAFVQASYKKTGDRIAYQLNSKAGRDLLIYESDPDRNPAAVYVRNEYIQRSIHLSSAVAWYPNEHISANLAVDGSLTGLDSDAAGIGRVRRTELKSALAVSARAAGFSAQGSLLHSLVRDSGTAALSRLTPTLLAGWSKGKLSFRAFHKTIFRTPTLNELYYTQTGYVKLKPEYCIQWNLGGDAVLADGKTFSSKLSADFYLNRIEDKIVAMPGRSQFRWSMVNFGLVKGCGAELSSDSRLRFNKTEASLLLNYSCERARDYSFPDSHWYGGQIPYTPWHSASAVLALSTRHWRAHLSCLYTGKRYRASDNTRDNLLDPWSTVDAAIVYLINSTWELGVDINNILNQSYEVISRYPMPGTNILFKITITV